MREISLDTETTGFEPKEGHRIVEIGCVEMVNRIRTGKTFHVYLNPQRTMPVQAFEVHGLSDEFLADKPLFSSVADEFLEFVGDSTLVIHNKEFDMRFINAELERFGKPTLPLSQAFCTLKEARKRFPGAQASLDALCKKFDVDNSSRTKHGALLDAELLADMYFEMMGGNQEEMQLATEVKQAANTQNVEKIDVRPSRSTGPTEEELQLHEDFLKKLKKPVWQN